jgi:hypothetical protein
MHNCHVYSFKNQVEKMKDIILLYYEKLLQPIEKILGEMLSAYLSL